MSPNGVGLTLDGRSRRRSSAASARPRPPTLRQRLDPVCLQAREDDRLPPVEEHHDVPRLHVQGGMLDHAEVVADRVMEAVGRQGALVNGTGDDDEAPGWGSCNGCERE